MRQKRRRPVFMAVDQYGTTEHGLVHPRKELTAKYPGRVSKQYTDTTDGRMFHTGYVVGPRWFTLYEVIPFRGEA